MQQIGAKAVRLFKLLAGQEREGPVSSYTYALYAFLFVTAMVLFLAWMSGLPT